MINLNITFRREIKQTDIEAIENIVTSSGFFSSAEIEVALELAYEKLAEGAASSYEFLFAEVKNIVCGYSCFGLIPLTSASYDLYWIAVNDNLRGQSIGKKLLSKSEKVIFSLGGRRIYVETSSRNQYRPTHNFYENCGYQNEAILKDFYSIGDSKIIYVKSLNYGQ
ncbi:MAG: GNAT family N-acetyltransferase [Smithellaceae bacterium]|jgi:ribosomal protein S18 acetylase RimI-like enzyme